MKPRLARGQYRKTGIAFATTFFCTMALFTGVLSAPPLATPVFADCIELAEIPMDTQETSGPGLIMFLLDDSGSMDWEYITTESSGLYSSDYYLWSTDPGDNAYDSNYPQEYEKMQWMRRWSGYNRIFYNPESTYTPWPRWNVLDITDEPTWSDPLPATTAYDMDWQTPRSNPIESGSTLNMDDLYFNFSSVGTADIQEAGGIIVDNKDQFDEAGEIIVDNYDYDNYHETGTWGDSGASGEYNSQSRYTRGIGNYATWVPPVQFAGTYKVYIWYAYYSTRDRKAKYTVHHTGGDWSILVNQRINGGQWVELGDFNFDVGTSGYIRVERTGADPDSASTSADAVKLVPQFALDAPEIEFEAGDGWTSTNSSEGYDGYYLYTSSGWQNYWATWRADNLNTSEAYDVYAWWGGNNSTRLSDVHYRTFDKDLQVADKSVNQYRDRAQWNLIAEGVVFSSGTGIVEIRQNAPTSGMCADAVAFVPALALEKVEIGNAHYYVQNENGTFLVNLFGGEIEYFRVIDDDNNKSVAGGELDRLELYEAEAAGIVTGRSYLEERVNFANWYSFYRRRELTAKNAVGNVINNIYGVFVGIHTIHDRVKQIAIPVKVTLDGTYYDETDYLLTLLYGIYSASNTPLRTGLQKIGKYYSGDYLSRPSTGVNSLYTTTTSFPYFKADEGGSCQQAFCIAMTDGFWNGSTPYGIANADGDGNTEFDGGLFADRYNPTLADVAMHYYENDLNPDLDNVVPMNYKDKAPHQHMVTYTLSFGVDGTLNRDEWQNCPFLDCPTWPEITADQNTTIDDLFHAAINGRGMYVNAGTPEELLSALEELRQDIQSRLGSAAALATNTIQRVEGSMIYQGTYHTDNWSGDLSAMPVNVNSGNIGDEIWSASAELEKVSFDDRVIVTSNGTTGAPFRWGSLTTEQQSMLISSDYVDYLRGDDSNYSSNGGSFRTRSSKMGDVVHSSPFYYRNVVYIGANDGMLHAFNSDSGTELFAYVPNIIYENLDELGSVSYSHKFYVDGTAYAKNIGDRDIMVCGLRRGGKGYFSLDVSSVSSGGLTEDGMAGKFLWEYSGAADDDMGYSYSRAWIVKTGAGWVTVFGNGYDSVNQEAVLFILDALTGEVLAKLKTGAAGCNGLSTPAIVDVDVDGYVDYAYAGDLRGNLWKFDLRDGKDKWKVAFADGSTAKPLFTAKNKDGQEQPITSSPDVMYHCDLSKGGGYIVVFGTGQYLGYPDFTSSDTQTIYGIWDWVEAWPKDTAEEQLHFGEFTTERGLTNIQDNALFSAFKDLTLLQQTIEYSLSEYVVITANEINYFNPSDSEGDHVGWHYDLPNGRERVVRDVMIRQGIAIVVSTIPSSSPCSSGGSSILYQLDACSGGRPDKPQFDLNNDGEYDENDMYDVNGDDDTGDGSTGGEDKTADNVTITGMIFDQLLFEPTELGNRLYLNDSSGNINDVPVPEDPMGMSYWLIVE